MGVKVLARVDDEKHMQHIDADDVDSYLSQQKLVWYNLITRDPREIAALHKTLGIRNAPLNDAIGAEQLPKFNDYGDQLFVIMHGLAFRDDVLDTTQLNCVITKNLFVTIAERSAPGLDWLWNAVQQKGYLEYGTPDELLGELAEVVGHRYLSVITELDQRIDDVYDRALSADPNVLSEIQVLRREETGISKVLRPQRIALNDLRRLRVDTISEHGQTLIGDAFDVHNLVVESLRSARSLLADALDTYRGSAGDRQSQATIILAVYSAVLLPLTLMTGAYGMNVPLPGQNNPRSWIVIAMLMIAIAVGSVVYFARRGFIRAPFIREPKQMTGLGAAASSDITGAHRQTRRAQTDGDPGARAKHVLADQDERVDDDQDAAARDAGEPVDH